MPHAGWSTSRPGTMKNTRLSFRPRPLDINKQLEIVRDVKDLDEDGMVSREISHNHEGLDKDNEEVGDTAITRPLFGLVPSPRFSPLPALP